MAQSPKRPSSWIRVGHCRTERFDGCSGLYMHHPKPAAVSLRSQSIISEMPFWLSHQSIRHSRLCTTRDTNVKTMQTQNQFNTNSIQHHETNNKNQSPINQSITSRHPNNMPIMSRRESRFFEKMNCGVRRLIYNSPSYIFSYFHTSPGSLKR